MSQVKFLTCSVKPSSTENFNAKYFYLVSDATDGTTDGLYIGDKLLSNDDKLLELINSNNSELNQAIASANAVINTHSGQITSLQATDDDFEKRIAAMETFFETAEGETLNAALDTLIEIQEYIDADGNVAKMVLEHDTAIGDPATTTTGEDGSTINTPATGLYKLIDDEEKRAITAEAELVQSILDNTTAIGSPAEGEDEATGLYKVIENNINTLSQSIANTYATQQALKDEETARTETDEQHTKDITTLNQTIVSLQQSLQDLQSKVDTIPMWTQVEAAETTE